MDAPPHPRYDPPLRGPSSAIGLGSSPWLLAAIYVLARLVVLAAAPLAVYNGEELYTGAVARELLAGPAFPLLDYQYEHYLGGNFLMGLVAAPFYAMLGSSFLTLKLVGLGWSLAGFLVWLRVWDRLMGPRARTAAAWFWAMAPVAFARQDLMVWGSHDETILYTGLMFLLFLVPGGEPGVLRQHRLGRRALFLCGFVSGLGLYACYTSALGLIVLALLWWALDGREAPRRGLAPFALGAAVGFTPWLIHNLVHRFAGLWLYGRPAWGHLGHGAGELPRRLWSLLARQLPHALAPASQLGTLSRLGGTATLALLAFAAIVALRAACRAHRGGAGGVPVAALLLSYPALYVGLYAVADVNVYPEATGIHAYRLLPPLLPWLAALFGLATTQVPRLRIALVPLAALLVASLAALGCDSTGREFHWTRWKGYQYEILGVWMRRSRGTFARQVEWARGVADADDRRACLDGLLLASLRERWDAVAGQGALPPEAVAAERALAASFPPEVATVARGVLVDEIRRRCRLGQLPAFDLAPWQAEAAAGGEDAAAVVVCRLASSADADGAVAFVATLPPPARARAWESFAECSLPFSPTSSPAAEAARVAALAPLEARASVYRGVGRLEPFTTSDTLVCPHFLPQAIAPGFRAAYLAGTAARVREAYATDPRLAEDLVASLATSSEPLQRWERPRP